MIYDKEVTVSINGKMELKRFVLFKITFQQEEN